MLSEAVADRSLVGARQLTNVICHRIATSTTLDPRGDTYADRVPQVDDPDWATYLDTLAQCADARRHELGQELAADPPQWALENLGPVPEDPTSAAEWADKAGAVAAHRDLTGHDDPAEPLGPAPKYGQVETYASWRSAWRALDRPESHRDELEMSDGQLRMRVRAAERENAWAPRYVGNELAATHQAAEQHRHTATLRQTEADNAADAEQREKLQRQADEASALAESVEARTAKLQEAEQARNRWLAHTAGTRAAADSATAELSARHADDEPSADDTVTAAEWLDAHQEAQAEEDQHREITSEAELADVQEQREADLDVLFGEVGHAVGGGVAADAGVGSMVVVPVEPVGEGVLSGGF